MPLSVNIKHKDPRFKGDQRSFYLTVSGPAELWTRSVENLLALNGLSRMGDGEARDFAVWSSRPQIGGPLTCLAAVLEKKYGARLSPVAKSHVKAAFDEVEQEDGLDAFFGNEAISPGQRALRVSVTKTDFVVNCDADMTDRVAALEAARWLPIENPPDKLAALLGSEPFRTRDPIIASQLEPFMTAAAKAHLKRMFSGFTRNIHDSSRQTAPEDFDIPAPEGESYLDFQKQGIHMIARSGKSGLIADDMGLGKTVQGIGVLNARPQADKVLVICQANMKLKWAREIRKWKTREDLTVGVAAGSTIPDTDIVVINYDIVTRNEEALRGVEWDLVITDEAHNLKNEEAKRTMSVLGELTEQDGKGPLPLSSDGIFCMLTGTPKPNRVSELWPLLTTIAPDIYGRGPRARKIFLNRYQPPFLIKKKFKRGNREFERVIPMNGKPVRLAEMQMSMKGTGRFVRRLKSQMEGVLPPKWRTPIDLDVRLSREQKEMLREAEADITSLLEELGSPGVTIGESRVASSVIDTISRIDPDTPQFYELARVRRNLGMLKAKFCADFIYDELAEEKDFAPEERTKTVIFAHHKDVIDILQAEAERRSKDIGTRDEKGKVTPGRVLVYDGRSGSDRNRQAIIDEFQENDEVRAIIISLAGATGITLTAAARMRVVEFDWSPSNMIQIEDRIWRIGQERNVDIGYMFIPGTLDSRIGESLIEKMRTNEDAIDRIRLHDAPAATRETECEKSDPDQKSLAL